MKIAIITSSFYPVIDGVTIAVYNRVRQLSKLGHQVLIFCPDYSPIKHIYPHWQNYTGKILPGVEVKNLSSTASIGLDFERDFTRKSYQNIVQELTIFKPDIIQVDEAERLGICFFKRPGVKFAKQNNIPCLAFFHTNYLEYLDDYFQLPFKLNTLIKLFLNWLFTKIYNAYDLTLVSSRATYNKLVARGIKNLQYSELLGLDLQQFNNIAREPNFFAQQYRINNLENKIKLIFIGRLTPDKGWQFGLQALAQLPSEIINQIAFIVVGDGDLSTTIKQELNQLTYRVYLLGRVPPTLIPQLLINSDIFVTNSTKETKGLAVIEACAAGIPVIAPRAGGITDTIIDGENGFLYQPDQQEEFLNKLNLLISDYDLRHSMGKKGKEQVQYWTWEKTTETLVNIWQQEIEKKEN